MKNLSEYETTELLHEIIKREVITEAPNKITLFQAHKMITVGIGTDEIATITIHDDGLDKLKSSTVNEFSETDSLAMIEAKSLAMSLWSKYYKEESPDFYLCDSVAGIISQIDNMTAGLTKLKG